MNFKFIVNTPMGLERVVSDEIKALGLETELENGRVYFEGDERTIVGRKLATSVYRSRTQFAILHAGALEKINGILAL